jgi:hypothetical protein
MPWYDDPQHPFAGICEKLKRADEDIANLYSEAARFFESCEYPIIPNPNAKEWTDAVAYHQSLMIPVRFGVLTGEIVHHLRSCLDHVVWHFTAASYRMKYENFIEFPVCRTQPTGKDAIERYERKIGGITNANIRKIIDDAQPYQRGNDAADDPICIIHDMDRFDKHRELILMSGCAGIIFPAGTEVNVVRTVLKYGEGKVLSSDEFAVAKRAMQKNPEVTPLVVLAQFGKRKLEPVVPALASLLHFMADLINVAADEV